ncbi:hypothetical protein HY386_01510 [Candidatus Daviesbacteria bacterium]|nr:hypothetical protein [Candidatus Daviesbacteria bacterium]
MSPDPAGLTQIEKIFENIISSSVALAFIALVVILVWAGMKFLTSGGEAKAIQSAQQTVTWAILGMVFLVVAWLILLLIKAFTGIDVTQFCISLDGC